jgi:integrase
MKNKKDGQRNSEQFKTRQDSKSGQEVAKQSFGKTDVRYWHEAIFKPTYKRAGQTLSLEDWAARIQRRGRRELFNLKTPNKARAATRARDIYTTLVSAGWDAALEKFKPKMQRKTASTVGEFLNELHNHWSGKPKTFQDYCRSFRTIVAQIFQIKAGKDGREKFDYVNGGRAAWIAKIDHIRLADVTPDKVNNWRIAFVKKVGTSPIKQKRARISCNSLMRQAKSLFSAELLAHVAVHKPNKLPFDGIAFYGRESMRYRSTVDIEALIQDAVHELPEEQLKIFLLATFAGLRRNEIDKLQWPAFQWNDGAIRIEATEHFGPKSSDSADDVPIDRELLAMFRGWHAKATSTFVIEAGPDPQIEAGYTHYRADCHFVPLTQWLRRKGVTAAKPLHELRKEFGSQLCAKYGIYAASRALRHSGITITAEHYLDQKQRVTLGLGDLLTAPDNVTAMRAES